MTDQRILVAGAGGFIGGHLVADLRRRGSRQIRAVDLKPIDQWHQRFSDVENLELDLRELKAAHRACEGVCQSFHATIGQDSHNMGFIPLPY